MPRSRHQQEEPEEYIPVAAEHLPAAAGQAGSVTRTFSGQESFKAGQKAVLSYLLSLQSEKSRQTMMSFLGMGLKLIEREPGEFDWSMLRMQIVQVILTKASRKYAPATANNILAAFKGVARALWMHKVLSHEEYEFICCVKPARGVRLPKGRALQNEEIDILFAAIDKMAANPYKLLRAHRDAAIFAVLIECGLRRSECAELDFDDVHLDEAEPYLDIIGKGNKERICYLPPHACERMRTWVADRGDMPGPCFYRVNKYGDPVEEGMTSQRIYSIVKEWQQETGLKIMTPHDMRRTYASALLENGVDLDTVKDMMGHSSVVTTSRYDKRGTERMKDAARNLNFGRRQQEK